MPKPKVFISYSWDNDKHMQWVERLCNALAKNNISPILDRTHLQLGEMLPDFMERSISNSDFVLIICTPIYKKKADGLQASGVKYEKNIISAELLNKGNHTKFIPILRNGTKETSIPISLSGKKFCNLKGCTYNFSGDDFDELVITLTTNREITSKKSCSQDKNKKYRSETDNIYDLLHVEPLEMEIGEYLLPLFDERSDGSGNFIDRIVSFKKQFAADYGVVIPTIRMRDNGMLNPNQYVVKIKGDEVGRGEILMDYYLALNPGGATEDIDGIYTVEPAYGIISKWITEDMRETAQVYGYTVMEPLSVIVTHMSEIIKRHVHELLSRQDIFAILENTEKHNPTIVADVIPNLVSIGDLQKILCNLLREGVPIKNMETILDTLGDYGAKLKDTDMLTEYVRQRLRRTITRQYVSGNVLKVVTVDQEVEQEILGGIKKGEHGTYLALEPEKVVKIVGNLIDKINSIKDIVTVPIVLTSPIVRIYLKKMLDNFNPDITVLSFSEIDPNVQIQPLANVQI